MHPPITFEEIVMVISTIAPFGPKYALLFVWYDLFQDAYSFRSPKTASLIFEEHIKSTDTEIYEYILATNWSYCVCNNANIL